jgi:hypothetical protein
MSATLSSRRSGSGTRSESIFAPLQTGEIFAETLSGGLAAQVQALAVMPCVPRQFRIVV